DADETVVVAYPQSLLIDRQGRELGLQPGHVDTRPGGTVERFYRVVVGLGWCDAIYGLMRTSALRKTALFRRCFAPDNLLLAEISLSGHLARLREPLFYRRLNRARETAGQMHSRVIANQNPTGDVPAFWRRFPYATLFVEHWQIVSGFRGATLVKLGLYAR